MEIELDFSKSIEKNAEDYFEKSKKAKKKLEGLAKASEIPRQKIELLKKNISREKKPLHKKRKHFWFEAFHWFVSEKGFLVVAGRSAKENEMLVKKHLEKNDLFLHADIQGGAATIIKSEGKKIPDETIAEAAQFAGVFSKAWSSGLSSVDVYAVSADQVSKKAPSGESLGTGSFMIYGKRKWFKPELKLSLGIKKENNDFIAVSGPESSVKKQALVFLEIRQGNSKPGACAKKIIKALAEKAKEELVLHPDEIIKMLPSGGISF